MTTGFHPCLVQTLRRWVPQTQPSADVWGLRAGLSWREPHRSARQWRAPALGLPLLVDLLLSGKGLRDPESQAYPPGEHGKEARCPVCEPVTGRAGTTREDGESAVCQGLGSHLDSCGVRCSWSGSGSPREVAEARGPTAGRGAVGAGIRLLSPVGDGR